MAWKRNKNEIDPLNYSTTVIFMVAWLYEGSFRNLFPLRWPTNRFRLFPRNVTSDLNIKHRSKSSGGRLLRRGLRHSLLNARECNSRKKF